MMKYVITYRYFAFDESKMSIALKEGTVKGTSHTAALQSMADDLGMTLAEKTGKSAGIYRGVKEGVHATMRFEPV